MLSTMHVGRFVLVRATRLPLKTGFAHIETAAEMPGVCPIQKQGPVSVQVIPSTV